MRLLLLFFISLFLVGCSGKRGEESVKDQKTALAKCEPSWRRSKWDGLKRCRFNQCKHEKLQFKKGQFERV